MTVGLDEDVANVQPGHAHKEVGTAIRRSELTAVVVGVFWRVRLGGGMELTDFLPGTAVRAVKEENSTSDSSAEGLVVAVSAVDKCGEVLFAEAEAARFYFVDMYLVGSAHFARPPSVEKFRAYTVEKLTGGVASKRYG
ncbi:hypothetical protein [Streptomyces sp. YKOK-I1]